MMIFNRCLIERLIDQALDVKKEKENKMIIKRMAAALIKVLCMLLVIGLTACAGSDSLPANATLCKEPRQPMCTREYRPVCGVSEDGTVKVYGNGCDACAHSSVVYFTPAACNDDPAHNYRPGRPVDGD